MENNDDNIMENNTTKNSKKWYFIIGGLAVGLFAGWLVITYFTGNLGPPNFHGMVMQSPDTLTNFTLDSANGDVSLTDFRGKVTLLYFGYTFCPDVCPATMVELKKAMVELGRDADDVQVIMVTIDPTRDTPEKIDAYVKHFYPSFIGLTGTDEEVAAVAVPLGIFYEKHEGSAESGYLIDHTATVAVIDKDGYLRLIYPFNTAGEDIAKDLRYLVRD